MPPALQLDLPPPATTSSSRLEPATFKRFLLAGNAIFTAVSERTGTRFTFKVTQPRTKPNQPHFVSVLSGPDNENHYTFVGTIFQGQDYQHGRKSSVGADSPRGKAARWICERTLLGLPLNNISIYHRGRCARCGRTLTVPESIQTGFGPECAQAL